MSLSNFAKQLHSDQPLFKKLQRSFALEFQRECQRFRIVKESTELSVIDLDTISNNAAKNILSQIAAVEINVTFQIVRP